jgi:hypothetical protein
MHMKEDADEEDVDQQEGRRETRASLTNLLKRECSYFQKGSDFLDKGG